MSKRAAEVRGDPLLSEAEVLSRYPILSAHTLKRARKDKTIAWDPGKWRSPWYRVSAIEDFINRGQKPCLAPEQSLSSNSKANGSPATQARPTFTDSGLSPELAERVGRHLAQRI